MFLSRISLLSLPGLGGLIVAASALLLAAGPARAQPPGPHIPVNAKAYQAGMIRQEFAQRQSEKRAATRPLVRAPVPQPLPPAGLQLTVSVLQQPPAPEPASVYVDLQGPNGKVRTFPLEGGREAIQPQRVFVLLPGESATIHVGGATPRR